MPVEFVKWDKLFKYAQLKFKVKPLDLALFQRVADKNIDDRDADALYHWHEECRKGFAELENLFTELGRTVSQDTEAYQSFFLSADDLEDSIDPDGATVVDSVLLTKSQTAIEFNWPRTYMQNCTIQIGPGAGVQDHAFIQNLDFQIMGFQVVGAAGPTFSIQPRRAVAMPYVVAGATKKLWIGQFQYDAAAPNGIRFQPSSLTAYAAVATKVVLHARPEL